MRADTAQLIRIDGLLDSLEQLLAKCAALQRLFIELGEIHAAQDAIAAQMDAHAAAGRAASRLPSPSGK